MDSRNVTLDEISFVNSTEGWGVSEGNVVHTQDGGRTWTVKRSPSLTPTPLKNFKVKNDAQEVQFLSATHGWVLEGDTLIATTDGGSTWKQVSFRDAIVRSFYFVDRETGWAVGERRSETDSGVGGTWKGCLYVTTDGGEAWKEVSLGTEVQHDWALFDVWASSSKNIWVVGSFILHSEDAGHTWKQVEPCHEVYGIPTEVGFVNPKNGWIMTNQGSNFCMTTDGGSSWQIRTFPDMKGGISKLVQTSPSTLWAVGQSGAYQSTDGGLNWEKALGGSFYTAQHLAEGNMLIVAGDQVAFRKL